MDRLRVVETLDMLRDSILASLAERNVGYV